MKKKSQKLPVPSITPSLHHSASPHSSTNPLIHQSINPNPPALRTRYVLRKHLGVWQVTFAGRDAIFKHEQGALYVAYLLLHPPAEPIHALDLATRIAALHSKQAGLPEIVDPVTGRFIPLQSDARIQERSLGLDAAQTMRATIRSQNQLEAILEDQNTIEPVREEVQRELIDLYRYEENNTARIRDSAAKAVRAVSMALKRLCLHLAHATDSNGKPHPVLPAFAEHLRKYLLVPSGRFAGAGRARARNGLAGCFTYQPPTGIIWQA